MYYLVLKHVCACTNPQVWETHCDGIFNLTQCVEQHGKLKVEKCSMYWPSEIGATEDFIIGDGSKISVTRIDENPLQNIIDEEEEDLDSERASSKRGEKSRLEAMIKDPDMFQVRTFELEHGGEPGETRKVTQYHVTGWKDNTGLIANEDPQMRDFLHFLVEQVDAHCRNMDTGPPIIHCRQVHHTQN